MAWSTVTEAKLLSALNDAELAKYRNVAKQEGQDDPLPDVLLDVTNLVRGYVRKRYALEAIGIPPSLMPAALDVAIYRLAKRVSSNLAEDRRKAYEDAIKLLEQVASGDFGIEDAVLSTEEPQDPSPSFADRTLSHTRDDQDGI